MPLRELLHDQLDMVAVFGPVDAAVVAALPAAVDAHLHSPAGADLLRQKSSGQAWGSFSIRELELAGPAVVRTTGAGLDVAALAVRSTEIGYPIIPLSVLISRSPATGFLVSMMFPHDLFDGTMAWKHMREILHRATSTWEPSDRLPVNPSPVRSALKKSGLTSRATLGAARAARRTAELEHQTADQFPAGLVLDRDRRLSGFRSVTLSAEDLRHLDTSTAVRHGAVELPDRSRRTMKLTELVLDAAALSMNETHDFGIRFSIDLRRYAPKGLAVEGPFSTAFPFGKLRTTDNSAAALTARLKSVIADKGPFAALLGDMLGLVKQRVRHPFARPVPDPVRHSVGLGVSVLPSQIPASFWAADAGDRVNAALLLHPVQASNPYIQIGTVDDEVILSVWDETGSIDLEGFANAIPTLLASREPSQSPVRSESTARRTTA
ncbi:hypothetical protein BH09ACT1_BH09ACT1_08040 [soil metagenome]